MIAVGKTTVCLKRKQTRLECNVFFYAKRKHVTKSLVGNVLLGLARAAEIINHLCE